MTVSELCQHLTGEGLQGRTVTIEPIGWLRAWWRWVRQSERLYADLVEETQFEQSVAGELTRLGHEKMERRERPIARECKPYFG